MRVSIALLSKKEFRQNILIYLFPLPFWLALVTARFGGGYVIPAWLGPFLTYAVPFTLAIGYGLQAFDVEEDAQTRDFLLVKPLSTWQIVLSKFCVGLLPLLIWVFLMLGAANPSILTWPEPKNVSSWAGGLLLVGAVLAYGASFLSGLLVRGPRKLLVAPVLGLVLLIFCFIAWSSWVTFLSHLPLALEHPRASGIGFYLAAALLLFAVLGLLLALAVWVLRERPRAGENRTLLTALGCAAFPPLIFICLNLLAPPLLRAVYFRGLELFGLDHPYWAVEGAWWPHHTGLAIASPGNVLCLARPGRKPTPIYRGRPGKDAVLTDLAWSPDGKYIAFVENGRVSILRLGDQKAYPLGKGSLPCWSYQGDALVFAEEITPPRRFMTETGIRVQHTLGIRMVDLRRGSISSYVELGSLSTRWFWDSRRGNILTVDYQGRLMILNTEGVRMLALPDAAGSGVFWQAFYAIPEKPAEFVLAVMNIVDAKRQLCTVRFYRYDAEANCATLLDKLTNLGFVNLILDPTTGVCLIGHDGVYRSRHLRGLGRMAE